MTGSACTAEGYTMSERAKQTMQTRSAAKRAKTDTKQLKEIEAKNA